MVISVVQFHISIVYFPSWEGKQIIGIPIETNIGPFLVNLFHYSNEPRFIQKLIIKNELTEAKTFNLTLRCVDEVLSTNNQNLLIIIHSYTLAVFT
jgi:hypothetical protein